MRTVPIATRSGSTTLPGTLEALARLDQPPRGWRLVGVGNGGAARGEARLRRHRERLPFLSYVFEPRRGQNAARNAGLDHVEGDLVVFTDDGVLPRADRLVRLRMAADEHPDFSIFGGSN
jgi:glycosyltransferase involved in cell wall biosynthesis